MKLKQIIQPVILRKINFVDQLFQSINQSQTNSFIDYIYGQLQINQLQQLNIFDADFGYGQNLFNLIELSNQNHIQIHYVAIVDQPLNKAALAIHYQQLKLSDNQLAAAIIEQWPIIDITHSVRINHQHLTLDLHFNNLIDVLNSFSVPLAIRLFKWHKYAELGYVNYFDLIINDQAKVNLDSENRSQFKTNCSYLLSMSKEKGYIFSYQLDLTQLIITKLLNKTKLDWVYQVNYDEFSIHDNQQEYNNQSLKEKLYQFENKLFNQTSINHNKLLAAYYLSRLTPIYRQNNKQSQYAIAGAGIAGCSMAYHLKINGIDCSLYDPQEIAFTANPRGLIYYQLMDEDSNILLATINAYAYSSSLYKKIIGDLGCQKTVISLHQQSKAFIKLNNLGFTDLYKIIGNKLEIPGAIINPQVILKKLSAKIKFHQQLITLSDLPIIYANSINLGKVLNNNLLIYPIRGQLEILDTDLPYFTPQCNTGYIIHYDDNKLLVGASHIRNDNSLEFRQAEKQYNLNLLADLLPYKNLNYSNLTKKYIYSKVGLRAGIRDRKPIFGRTIAAKQLTKNLHRLDLALLRETEIPWLETSDNFVLGGFASRGYTYAPWSAMIVSDLIIGRRPPINPAMLLSFSSFREELKILSR